MAPGRTCFLFQLKTYRPDVLEMHSVTNAWLARTQEDTFIVLVRVELSSQKRKDRVIGKNECICLLCDYSEQQDMLGYINSRAGAACWSSGS